MQQKEEVMETTLTPKRQSLFERAAAHRLALTIGIFGVMGAIIGASSGIGVSSGLAENIRTYLTAIFR